MRRISWHLAERTWQRFNIIFIRFFKYVYNPVRISIVVFFFTLEWALYVYMGRGSSSTGGTLLQRHVSTVAQNGQIIPERTGFQFIQKCFGLRVLGRRGGGGGACYPHGYDPILWPMLHTPWHLTNVFVKRKPLSYADVKINRWPDDVLRRYA